MCILSLAPDDYMNVMGTLLVTGNDREQCVNISVINDGEDEQDRECFAFVISTSDVEGISLGTTQATVCIIDDDGKENTWYIPIVFI